MLQVMIDRYRVAAYIIQVMIEGHQNCMSNAPLDMKQNTTNIEI